ncbi:MAG: hypothetical protein WBN97_07200 [Parvibaculum sp.]
MKKTFALTGLALALAVAAPFAAQADTRVSAVRYNGPAVHGSVVVVERNTDYSGYRTHKNRIVPLAQMVRSIERETGATVTDIKLAQNARVYLFEGVTQRGFIVQAKADAYSGKIGNVQVTKFRPNYDPKGMPINRLLATLRDKGYHDFDLVSLKDERGIYQVRGLNRHGQAAIVRADARTGRILTVAKAPKYHGPAYAQAEYRAFDVWKPMLEKQRYTGFDNVVAYDDYYAVDARNQQGRKVRLEIDAFSGQILRD